MNFIYYKEYDIILVFKKYVVGKLKQGNKYIFFNLKNFSGLIEMLKGGILFYFVKFLGKKDSILVNVIDIFFYKYKGRSSYII